MGDNKENRLKTRGFCRYQLADEITDISLQEALDELYSEFANLPIDQYAPDLNRYRRYSRAIIIPQTNEVIWLNNMHNEAGEPISEYFQGRFNPEYVGSYRRFPALSERVKANKLLERIIQFDFRQTFWDERDLLLPVHAGVHFVKLQVKSTGDVAVSSPNCLHQDGEPFTFAHLVKRDNVVGGINVIAEPECAGKMPDEVAPENVRDTFTLTEPLQSYGVCDQKVSHYVSSVQKGPADRSGERSVILIDFQPTVVAPHE